jgi:hypothetical protein
MIEWVMKQIDRVISYYLTVLLVAVHTFHRFLQELKCIQL